MRGIIRQVDTASRITIPVDFRNYLNIRPGDSVEIFITDNNELLVKKLDEGESNGRREEL